MRYPDHINTGVARLAQQEDFYFDDVTLKAVEIMRSFRFLYRVTVSSGLHGMVDMTRHRRPYDAVIDPQEQQRI